jgi:hypothetical protein
MKKNNLHNIKKTGFKVPEDYFNTLEDTILSHIKLEELSVDSGFKTPENYFDTLENTIINKVSEKETSKVIPLFSKRNLVYISSIAAAILLLFNLSIFQKKSSWNTLDIQTVENYIIEGQMSSYEISSLLSDEELIEENFINYNFNDENIESYLLDNLDINDLINE